MIRYAFVVKLQKNKVSIYEQLHKHPWKKVLDTLKKYNIRNYSIFIKNNLLFSYYEYHGNNHEKDLKLIASDHITQEWWKLTNPCQKPISSEYKTSLWAPMQEIFHLD